MWLRVNAKMREFRSELGIFPARHNADNFAAITRNHQA